MARPGGRAGVAFGGGMGRDVSVDEGGSPGRRLRLLYPLLHCNEGGGAAEVS